MKLFSDKEKSKYYKMPNLKQILEIENDDVYRLTKCPRTGVLVWPIIRNIFYRFIMSDFFYQTQPLASIEKSSSLWRARKNTAWAMLHNLLHKLSPCPVMIYASGAGVLEEQGASFNRYTGYFTDFFDGNTWSIEGIPWGDWPPTRKKGKLRFWLPAQMTWSMVARYGVDSDSRCMARKLIEYAAGRARKILSWDLNEERESWLINHLAGLIAALPSKKRYFQSLFDRIKPRLCLVEEGCYGAMAIFNATAKEQGICVAEFQHGSVTAGHDAYNLAQIFLENDDYKKILPDYFLSYGTWWNEQFNAPIEKVVIGNPHRETIISSIPKRSDGRQSVLILGEGRETQKYFQLCNALSRVLPRKYQVVFRPHPEERNFVKSLSAAEIGDFEIDVTKDIYPSLANANTVISELSTASFEAVGLARNIFIWRTDKSRFNLPDNPFAEFSGVSDIALKIESGAGAFNDKSKIEAIWASGWRARFKSFIESVFETK